jgi:hypothetical protein
MNGTNQRINKSTMHPEQWAKGQKAKMQKSKRAMNTERSTNQQYTLDNEQ